MTRTLGITIVVWGLLMAGAPRPVRASEFAIDLPPGWTWPAGSQPAVSPAGVAVVAKRHREEGLLTFVDASLVIQARPDGVTHETTVRSFERNARQR